MSLRFSALAGAFLVGVAGAKWITNEVDKRLLTESVKVAVKKTFQEDQSEHLTEGSPRQVLLGVKQACENYPQSQLVLVRSRIPEVWQKRAFGRPCR